MPVHLKKPLKDGDTTGGGQGRMYDKELAAKPGNIKIGEVALGMQLAIVAITDDKEGTLEQIGKGNPWHIHAMELVTGSTVNAFKPLSQILPDHMGFELDRAFSHTKITGGLHCVDTQGYIAHNENDVVLAYRCTIGGFDWLTNFSASTSEFEPEEDAEQGHSGFLSCLDGRCMGDKPRVHTGFYNGFLVSQPDVLELLEPHIKDSKTPKRIFVVGHSLGAGVATVAFIYLLLKYNWLLRPHKLILVTAGGPRVCDESMAIKVQNKVKELRPQDKCCICRLVRDQDVVPNVPLGLMGFRHLNKLLYFNKSGELMINPAVESADDDQEEKTAVDAPASVMEEMKDLKEKVFDHEAYKQVLNMIPGRFVDHMPDMYLEPLMGILAKTEPLQLKIISARGLKNADWIGVSADDGAERALAWLWRVPAGQPWWQEEGALDVRRGLEAEDRAALLGKQQVQQEVGRAGLHLGGLEEEGLGELHGGELGVLLQDGLQEAPTRSPAQRRVDECGICVCWDDKVEPTIEAEYKEAEKLLGVCLTFAASALLKEEDARRAEKVSYCAAFIRLCQDHLESCEECEQRGHMQVVLQKFESEVLPTVQEFNFHFCLKAVLRDRFKEDYSSAPAGMTELVFDYKAVLTLPRGLREMNRVWYARARLAVNIFGCFCWGRGLGLRGGLFSMVDLPNLLPKMSDESRSTEARASTDLYSDTGHKNSEERESFLYMTRSSSMSSLSEAEDPTEVLFEHEDEQNGVDGPDWMIGGAASHQQALAPTFLPAAQGEDVPPFVLLRRVLKAHLQQDTKSMAQSSNAGGQAMIDEHRDAIPISDASAQSPRARVGGRRVAAWRENRSPS